MKKVNIVVGFLTVCFYFVCLWALSKQANIIQEYRELVTEYQYSQENMSNTINNLRSKCIGVQSENDTLSQQVSDSADKVEHYVKLLDSTLPGEHVRVSRKDLILLSKVVQLEAGYPDKHKAGQQYITKVILNRVMSPDFPNTISDVLYQNGQFNTIGSVSTCDLQLDTVLNVYEVLNGMAAQDLPGYVTFFYSAKVKSGWVTSLPVWMAYDETVYAYEKGSEQ